MPQLGETVAEGKILTWFKAVGDDVKPGDRLFEVETDKVTVEVEAVVAGKLTDIRVGNGGVAPVGAVVAVVGGEVGAAVAKPAPGRPGGSAGKQTRGPRARRAGAVRATAGSSRGCISAFDEVATPLASYGPIVGASGLHLTPAARRLVSEHGLDADADRPRGSPSAVAAPSPAPTFARQLRWRTRPMVVAPPRPLAVTPAAKSPTCRRRGGGAVADAAEDRRAAGRELADNPARVPGDRGGFHPHRGGPRRSTRKVPRQPTASRSPICRSSPAPPASRSRIPRVNARFENGALTIVAAVNLGIAVDLNHNGLVVPVVRDAGALNLPGLALAILRQVEKARGNQLGADDFAGGTYSISNNGAFGTAFTAPIINAPQVAILSTDAIRKRPAVVYTAEGEFLAARLIGYVGQSFDHRVFDGAYSAAFLSRLKADHRGAGLGQRSLVRTVDTWLCSRAGRTLRVGPRASIPCVTINTRVPVGGTDKARSRPGDDLMKYNSPHATASWGAMAKDWEQGIDYSRLSKDRLRARAGGDPPCRPWRRARLQLRQHPLSDRHPHRRMGARQVLPLRAVPGRGKAVPVGPGAAGQAHLLALDRRQRRGTNHHHARRDPAVDERAARLRQAGEEGAGPLRHRQGAARHRHPRDRHAAGARGGGHRGGGRPAGDAGRPRDQDRRRDRTAEDGRRDGRRHLCRYRPCDPPRHQGERTGRHRQRPAVPHGFGAGRVRQFGVGPPRPPALAHLLRPHDPAGRHDLPRHHALLQRLPHLLLPHLHLRRTQQAPDRRLRDGIEVDQRHRST